MKSIIPCIIVLISFCIGCGKDETGCMGVKPEDEASAIQAYATANGLSVTKHNSGIYYNIPDSGYGTRPFMTSTVSVTYTGKLLNGTTFDSTGTPVTFPLSGVIEGWGIGLPLIKKGGTIKMIIPSALAYGCNGKGGIPPNAILYFQVHLVDVQ